MMKKKCMVLIIMTMFLISTSLIFSANVEILTNTGFESGATGWVARNCTFNAITGLSYTGSYCGQGTARTATWQGIKQSLLGKVTNGATYTVSGWLRVSAASDAVKCSVEQADGNGTQYIAIAEGTATNTGWVQLAGTITVSVTGTLSTFDLYFEGPAVGVDIYVDDASFYGPGVSTTATGTVDTGTRYQTMDGFGAAGGWYESNLVNHPSASTLYDLLFNQLGLDLYRFRNTYQIDSSYLDRQATLIAAAKAVRPALKIKVAAWSPPASMKSNGSTVLGTLAKNSDGTYMYSQFAQWWADSLADFATRGITPDYVSIQNEPDYTNSGWDTCEWAPTETTALAGFAEAFRAVYNTVGSSVKFVPPDCADFQSAGSYIDAFTATDKTHIYAYAHHLYAGLSEIVAFGNTYNDKPKWQTEYSNYAVSGSSTFDDAMNMALTMDTALVQEQVSAYFYWELFWTGSSGLISVESSSYTIRPVYYGFKQFSAFVDAGWQRTAASSDSLNLNMEAYISADNTKMSVIIINASTSAITLSLSNLNGFTPSSGTIYRTSSSENCANVGSFNQSSAMNIPARSITTVSLTGSGGTSAPTTVTTAGPTDAPTVDPTIAPNETLAPTDVPTATPAPTDTPAPTAVPTATPFGVTADPTAPPTTVTADPTTPPSETTAPCTCTCPNLCSSQTAIAIPFTKDGAGEFCFALSAASIGAYVNSWNCDSININGVSYTNTYVSGSSIVPMCNTFYIYYKSSYSWSHLEIK